MIHLRPHVSRLILSAPVALGCMVACGLPPRPAALILDHHRELTGRERELTARYAADLEAWFEAHQEAEVARRVITDLCTGAYGYAHETRLVQNLATLLALEGRLTEAREAYDLVRAMELYAEYPARFRSLEIFRDYLDRVGTTFPPLVGTAFDGSPLDTRDYRGRPLFIHFWRRLGSLNHDLEFLDNLQRDYPDLAVVSINVGDETEAVRQALLKHVPRWPFWHDRDGSYADSLRITFAGLYVHEPKGILLDREGRIAVMPGREGAIAIGLRALDDRPAGPAELPRPSAAAAAAGSVRELQQSHIRARLAARDGIRADLMAALRERFTRAPQSEAGARACLELLRAAAEAGAVGAAEEAWTLWERTGAEGEAGPGAAVRENYTVAMAFAYARAMLTCGDPERTAGLVYRAIGDRREREDLYLLCDLAAALSVLDDVVGAERAFEKIIEITGGAGSAAWEGYIAALDRVGHPIEPFTLPGLDGGIHSPGDYTGRLLLIDFWGSWCHACIREMPHAYEAWNRYHDRGFEVLGIVVRDTREKARAFLERTGYPWDQAFDADSSVAARHVVVGYPTTILVDGSGRVRCTRTFGGGLEIALRLLIGP